MAALAFAFLFSASGDRMWTFFLGIFVHKIGGILWVAVQQCFDSVIKLVAMPYIGRVLDRVNRFKALKYTLIVNNVAVAVSSAAFGIGFGSIDDEKKTVGVIAVPALIFAVLFSSVSRLASETQRTAFTKDWVVVIDDTERSPNQRTTTSLSGKNSAMTMIDQGSSLLIPLISGYFFENVNTTYLCFAIVLYNFTSWYIEWKLLLRVYKMTPALALREGTTEVVRGERTKTSWTLSLKLYFRQNCWLAAFGLALLYMTVLGFDNLAMSYGQSHGMSATTVGIFRSAGSGMGLMGAAAYPHLVTIFGVEWAALIGLIWQNVFIEMSGASTLMPGSPMNVTGYVDTWTVEKWRSDIWGKLKNPGNNDVPPVGIFSLPSDIVVFFLGITLARFGLWIADPAITEIMQRTIPETERYTVFLVQSSLCEAFSVFKDVLVFFFAETELFGALSILSCAFVFSGLCFYFSYFLQNASCRNRRAEAEETELRSNDGQNQEEQQRLVEIPLTEINETEAHLA
ncbi:unnamed protein product [Caenorhabditis auriculariae]|uniref:Solute carrier family 40 member n=1 Tax=Caenorhabditis auriculariae TaxID=2777116 RepID=A0A8S1GP72_9PELO|nr:unnamed protein product [Caenorhabditis auriculariae]